MLKLNTGNYTVLTYYQQMLNCEEKMLKLNVPYIYTYIFSWRNIKDVVKKEMYFQEKIRKKFNILVNVCRILYSFQLNTKLIR